MEAAAHLPRRSVLGRSGRPKPAAGAIHGEVLFAENRFHLWGRHQIFQEPGYDLSLSSQWQFLVKVVPDRIVWAQPHKPAKQQILIELLQPQALRADPKESLPK